MDDCKRIVKLSARKAEIETKIKHAAGRDYVVCTYNFFHGRFEYVSDLSWKDYRDIMKKSLDEVNTELAKYGH